MHLTAPPLLLELIAVPKAVPEARRAVREHLGTRCPDVELGVAELLANVIGHVGEGAPVRLRLTAGDGCVRVEVTDRQPCAWPVLRRAADDEEGGRGLFLLDAVALRWGVYDSPGGKTVWCELPLPEPG